MSDKKIIARLEELISLGERVLATKRSQGEYTLGDLTVDSGLAYQWATSTLSLLDRVLGKDSAHYFQFSDTMSEGLTYSPVVRGMGILRAALDDFQGGYLFDVRQLIQAEIFDEFLEQAQHLLEAGYHQPAAVIVGCVLEDGLRKLCQHNSISLPDKPKLDRMNANLAKVGVYNTFRQKQITAFADLRNKAAHGKWDQFTKDEVSEMIDGVRKFMESHHT